MKSVARQHYIISEDTRRMKESVIEWDRRQRHLGKKREVALDSREGNLESTASATKGVDYLQRL